MSHDIDVDQLKRFYNDLYDLAIKYPHPSADSPIEDILLNIGDWIDHVDKAKEVATDGHPAVIACLDGTVEMLRRASFNYYASFK